LFNEITICKIHESPFNHSIIMGYSAYKKIKTVVKKFKINLTMVDLFSPNLQPTEPSLWLAQTLKKATVMVLTNEKAKSERVISPILVEIAEQYSDKIALFSGENLEVIPSEDLSGECDFFFSLHPPQPFIDAPIISLVEAKDEDMTQGMAQCAAQMYGAKLYNEAEGKPISVIYGCATTGIEWRFLRLENNTLYMDNNTYSDLKIILTIWHTIIQSYLN
jgi:hypothetical protein